MKQRIPNIAVVDALHEYGDLADESIWTELSTIVERNVFKGVHLSGLSKLQRQSMIKSKLIITLKKNSKGEVVKLKSRLLCRGDQENRSTWDSLYSPTSSLDSVLITLGVAAYNGWFTRAIDVKSAYLYCPVVDDSLTYVLLEPDVANYLIRVDPSFAKFQTDDGYLCCEMMASLYGALQSSKNLWIKIRATLLKMGFTNSQKENCVFVKKFANGESFICTLYVDDLHLISSSNVLIDEFILEFQKDWPEIVVSSGDEYDYLGMCLNWRIPGSCQLSMPAYCNKVVDKFEKASKHLRNKDEIFALKKTSTPAKPDAFQVDQESPLLNKLDKSNFHTLIATIAYLAKRTFPQLMTISSFLIGRVQFPTQEDWTKLEKVVAYIHYHRDFKLIISPKNLNVEVMVDASHSCHSDFRGHLGILYTLGGAMFCVKSKKAFDASLSSTEDESMSISYAAPHALWARDLLTDLGFPPQYPTLVFCDNEAVLKLVERGSPTSSNSKHFKNRFYYTKSLVDRHYVFLQKVHTDLNISDILTKCLDKGKFTAFTNAMLNSYSYAQDKDLYRLLFKSANKRKRQD